MSRLVFLVGVLIFAISSVYFWLVGRRKGGLNAAFLVSFITLISYVIMWQGNLTVTAGSNSAPPAPAPNW